MGARTEALILVCLLCSLSSCAIDAKKTHYYDFVVSFAELEQLRVELLYERLCSRIDVVFLFCGAA